MLRNVLAMLTVAASYFTCDERCDVYDSPLIG